MHKQAQNKLCEAHTTRESCKKKQKPIAIVCRKPQYQSQPSSVQIRFSDEACSSSMASQDQHSQQLHDIVMRNNEALQFMDIDLIQPYYRPYFVQTKETRPELKRQGSKKSDDFYANVGDAIRTLREDIPQLFQKELNYDIYRDDIVFRDPQNEFYGLENYKRIFWSLRFHGKLFFKNIYVEVQRIWQIDEKVIQLRWRIHAFPRLTWNTHGIFDGCSKFKLDRQGLIYEHQLSNVIFRDPPIARLPLFSWLNLQPVPEQAIPPAAFSWKDCPQLLDDDKIAYKGISRDEEGREQHQLLQLVQGKENIYTSKRGEQARYNLF